MRRKLPRSRVVTAEQVQSLLADGKGVIDPDLSRIALTKTYRLSNGGALVVNEDADSRLYESLAELQAMLNDDSDFPSTHPLAGRLPQGPTFDADAPRLAAELVEQADVPLDGSSQSLEVLDDLVRQHGADSFLGPDKFPRLLAYIGDVVRNSDGGRWEMILNAEDGIWEPWIVDASGTRHPVFGMLVKELMEWDDEISSIAGLMAARVSPNRQRRPKRRLKFL